MTSIHNIYEPYNFTENPCYIITIPITTVGYVKIEHKLPEYIKTLKGVFVSVDCKRSLNPLAGMLIMNFNDQLFKNFQLPIIRTNLYLDSDHSKPIPFNEAILPNSFLQGFYYDSVNMLSEYPYNLKIYLHHQTNETKS